MTSVFQVRSLKEELEISVIRAQTETRKEERRRAEKEKQDLKTNFEAEIAELQEAVDELTNENRQLHVQQTQRDTNETLLKSEITQLKLDLDEKKFEVSHQKETHEAYVTEQKALLRGMGVIQS